MKKINTLVQDIYKELENRGGWDQAITDYFLELMKDFADTRMATPEEQEDRGPTLRLSQMGTPCKRKLWYNINQPNSSASLPPSTLLKFKYGDIIEALILSLAKAAGHKVEGEQDTLYVEGIKGHRDAVIDGVTVDVKSASSYAFKKFESGGLRDDDPFGYISQLSSYVLAGRDHEVESHPTLGAFLAIDKQNGTICLDMYDLGPEIDQKVADFQYIKEMVKQPNPPERTFTDEPDGKSGNRKLCIQCSYCDYKSSCWPKLRTFLYSGKPRFLTEVAREPRVPELNDD
jgi:hypothetical protein